MKEEKHKAPDGEKTGLPPHEEAKLVAHEEPKELKAPPEEKLLESGTRAKELEERLMRLQAEFENYKKRMAKENDFVRENASADVLLKLLPVVDEFELAMAHMDHAPHKEFKRGMELIFAKLIDLVKKEGIEEMKTLGQNFDPYKHDALRQGDGEEGKIIEVVQKGYLYRGKVLRHAKVVVGKGNEVK
ncbi:MAG: nucleotide exchange factor GrpE [Candidatus ainarchaeum sp.]|nr:nucleotide exchange factor GrpE [Candidatus ainarchaeum sp.]